MMEEKNFVLLYGFGYSGSGAVLDLLKEVDNVSINKSFFSIIKNPYGIISLEDALVDHWDFVRSDVAMNDFLWLCKHSAGSDKCLFKPAGLCLSDTLNNDFYSISEEYINSLKGFNYECWNEISDFKKIYIVNIFHRIARILNRRKIPFVKVHDEMSFSHLSKEQFYSYTKAYINKLFENYNEDDLIVLDHHPLPVQFADKLNDYFGENARMIVVDRDPRGIYYDLVLHRNRIGLQLQKTNDAGMYIEWHKALRQCLPKNDNILYLRFENLVNNYDEEVQKIFNFLNINPKDHKKKKKFFDPAVSKKNIDLWMKNDLGIPQNVFNELEKLNYEELTI